MGEAAPTATCRAGGASGSRISRAIVAASRSSGLADGGAHSAAASEAGRRSGTSRSSQARKPSAVRAMRAYSAT